jgi:hypothetical protein
MKVVSANQKDFLVFISCSPYSRIIHQLMAGNAVFFGGLLFVEMICLYNRKQANRTLSTAFCLPAKIYIFPLRRSSHYRPVHYPESGHFVKSGNESALEQ